MEAGETFSALVEEVCQAYSGDPSAAAVLTSRLPPRTAVTPGDWYMSICRFTEPFGKGKVVVASAREQLAQDCLSQLWGKWRGVQKELSGPMREVSEETRGMGREVDVAAERERMDARSRARKSMAQSLRDESAPNDRGKLNELLERLPLDVLYSAHTVFWFDPDGKMIVPKSRDDRFRGRKFAFSGQDMSAVFRSVVLGRDVVVVAFPYQDPYWQPNIVLSGLERTLTKKRRKTGPEPEKERVEGRFGALEFDEDEDEGEEG